MSSWLILFLAILSEVFGTAALKASDGFTKLIPTLGVVFGYGIAFVLLSVAVKTIPLGTAYAVWSGIGTVGAVVVGMLMFHEKLGVAQIAGVALIVLGTIILKFTHEA